MELCDPSRLDHIDPYSLSILLHNRIKFGKYVNGQWAITYSCVGEVTEIYVISIRDRTRTK
jgi:hypothetical protein